MQSKFKAEDPAESLMQVYLQRLRNLESDVYWQCQQQNLHLLKKNGLCICVHASHLHCLFHLGPGLLDGATQFVAALPHSVF